MGIFQEWVGLRIKNSILLVAFGTGNMLFGVVLLRSVLVCVGGRGDENGRFSPIFFVNHDIANLGVTIFI
jgi:hypothetical protein